MRSVQALVLISACLVEASRPGGISGVKDATPEVQAIANSVKAKLAARSGVDLREYEAVKYATQVVAGLNYFIKVRVGNNSYAHLRVFRNLHGEFLLVDYKLGLTLADPLQYF